MSLSYDQLPEKPTQGLSSGWGLSAIQGLSRPGAVNSLRTHGDRFMKTRGAEYLRICCPVSVDKLSLQAKKDRSLNLNAPQRLVRLDRAKPNGAASGAGGLRPRCVSGWFAAVQRGVA